MNDELIKRIDSWLNDYIPDDLSELLANCRAEIASLHEAAQQQAVVIERLSNPYVPMTEDELAKFWENDHSETLIDALDRLQDEVIKRAGLEIQND